jgi:hypothetical protein
MRVSFFITKVIERSGYVMRALAIRWGAPYQLVSHAIPMSVTEPLRGCAPITIEFFARHERGSEDLSNSYVVSFKQTPTMQLTSRSFSLV